MELQVLVLQLLEVTCSDRDYRADVPSQISDPDQRVSSVTSRSAAAANTHDSVSCREAVSAAAGIRPQLQNSALIRSFC